MFRVGSDFSAAELRFVLSHTDDRPGIVAELLAEAEQCLRTPATGPDAFLPARLLHTLGSAIGQLDCAQGRRLVDALPGLEKILPDAQSQWLEGMGLAPDLPVDQWCTQAKSVAFEALGQTILGKGFKDRPCPRNSLRKDEIVWGRAAARLDLGGGWTDTPPYSLEHGGCVINAAVNLNGQPPIHTYARVIEEPVIRITSVDMGTRLEIRRLDELLDYRKASSDFSLAKAALAISGFSPRAAAWREGVALPEMLKLFGGGIELTTLAAIPKGSGLGTSSIAGAVILSVIHRMMGRLLSRAELFHGVLQLEQSLTTGGGWQDQIGGVLDGVKVITTAPGLVPDANIHYVPADVLDPHANGGCTLLYYTGITRLAKNILRQVVGRYLDHQRSALATLRRLHALPHQVADAMARKDLPAFGHQIDVAWRLNKEIDPHSSTPEIEAILDRIRPHTHGAKLLGAGGGGFLLIVCKSPQDAQSVRETLTQDPPNPQARFFDYDISHTGLTVTVC
jgi:galactokinase/mevalonate kinase-like predicted kinase